MRARKATALAATAPSPALLRAAGVGAAGQPPHAQKACMQGRRGWTHTDTGRWGGGLGENKGLEIKVTGRDRRLRFLITENTSWA